MRDKFIGTELIKEAMRAKDKIKLQVVKNLKSDIIRKEGGKKEMSETEIINMIRKNIEGLLTNIEFYHKDKNDRADAIEEANAEIKILESFMPVMMSETEINSAVSELIKETGASEMKEMGKLMGMFSKKYGGKADNSIVSKVIKSYLS